MQGSFLSAQFRNIVNRNVDATTELFHRETLGNKTKIFASDVPTDCVSARVQGGKSLKKKPRLCAPGTVRGAVVVGMDVEEDASGSSGTHVSDDESNGGGAAGGGEGAAGGGAGPAGGGLVLPVKVKVEEKPNELKIQNTQLDKDYVILVSGFVTFKDFSRLWGPRIPFAMDGVDLFSVLKKALKELIEKTKGLIPGGGELEVEEFHKYLINLWKNLIDEQENLLEYGVSELVRAGETRVIHRLYDSGIFPFIYNPVDGGSETLLERLRKYLRRYALTKTMFSETVGLYVCWNGVTMNNRSTISEQNMMLEQFHTSFMIFAKFVKSRERDIKSEIEKKNNDILEY